MVERSSPPKGGGGQGGGFKFTGDNPSGRPGPNDRAVSAIHGSVATFSTMVASSVMCTCGDEGNINDSAVALAARSRLSSVKCTFEPAATEAVGNRVRASRTISTDEDPRPSGSTSSVD